MNHPTGFWYIQWVAGGLSTELDGESIETFDTIRVNGTAVITLQARLNDKHVACSSVFVQICAQTTRSTFTTVLDSTRSQLLMQWNIGVACKL